MAVPSVAQSLRNEGSSAFHSFNYPSAASYYTQAYETIMESVRGKVEFLQEEEKEFLAAVLSNRSACRINLFELDLALLDAAASQSVNPSFSRGKAREGEAFNRLQDYESCHKAYLEALELAEDDSVRLRYQAAATSAKQLLETRKKENVHAPLVAAEGSVSFAARFDKFVKDGGNTDQLVSANTAIYAWTMMDKACEVLDEKLKVLESGEVESVTPSPCLDIADVIITDPRGFHLPPGNDHDLPITEKLRLQLSWDTQVLGLGRFLKKNTIPKDVIDELDEEVKAEGWQKVRIALAHLIRGSVVAAYVNETQGRTLEACSQYRYALGLLQEGREKWKSVDETDRGATFRFTFERKVKMLLIESIVDGHYRSTTSEQRQLFSLEEVKALAEDLMDDCRLTKAPSDPISTFAFQIQPVVAAGKAFAYTLRDIAQLEENRIDIPCGYWLHPGMMAACSRLYSTAGELSLVDDPEKAINLFNALAFDLRAGGITIRQLFSRAAAAEAALVPPERIFGSSSRQIDSRILVRTACDTARSHLISQLPFIPESAFEATLKPIATVFASEIPEGKKWNECVDDEILGFLKGDILVAEYAALKK